MTLGVDVGRVVLNHIRLPGEIRRKKKDIMTSREARGIGILGYHVITLSIMYEWFGLWK